MAFSFSTPASQSTPGFGFGGQAASTPAFGASLPKASSTPLFGQAPASSAGGLFGPSTTSSFAFTPPAAASSASPFGQPASTPSLFGGASAPASTPSLFGAAPTAASTPSLFGAASAPAAATPSLFGATPTPTAGALTFGSSFGGPATGAQPTGLFGSAQAGAPAGGVAPLAFGAGGPPQAPDLSALRELESIKDSYIPSPANPRYRFQYLFLNVVENPAARVKPPNVDELQWREAMQRAGGPGNPDRLWPVPAQGFTDLLARKAAQDQAMQEHQARLESLSALAGQLVGRQETVIREQLESVRRRHLALGQQLLRLVRQIDALEARFGQAMGFRGGSREVLQQLAAQLAALEADLGSLPSAGLQGKVDALASAARMRVGAPSAGAGAPELSTAVDPASLEGVYTALSQFSEALTKLQDVVRRDSRDVAVLELAKGDAMT